MGLFGDKGFKNIDELKEMLEKEGYSLSKKEDSLTKEEITKLINDNNQAMLQELKEHLSTVDTNTINNQQAQNDTDMSSTIKALLEQQKALQESIKAMNEQATLSQEQFRKELELEQRYKNTLSNIPEGNINYIKTLEKNGVAKDAILKIIEENNLTSPINTEYKPLPTTEKIKTEAEEIASSEFAKNVGVTKDMIMDSNPLNPNGINSLFEGLIGNGTIKSPANALSEFQNKLKGGK